MPILPLRVQMLGDFTISRGGAAVSSGGDRSRALWLLLAYLICRRGETVSPQELTELLWQGGERSGNPANALKTLFHRCRGLLDRLGDGAGAQLLLRRDGGFAWNEGVPMELDLEEFTRLCQSAAGTRDAERRLSCLLEAARLYRGDFLARLSAEPWVVPIAARFRQLYFQSVAEALSLLEERGRWGEAAALCRTALVHDPCREELCRRLMEALLRLDDPRGAAAVYSELRERLLTRLGILPDEGLRELYQTALQAAAPQAISPAQLRERLEEDDAAGGALLCDFDFFRTVCRSMGRMTVRSGDPVHLALLSVAGAGGRPLTPRSLACAMDNLQELLRTHLRRGDAAARCTASQFALLLPLANYENSRLVCRRIEKAFARQYPHSPARLQAAIQPLAAPDNSSEEGSP